MNIAAINLNLHFHYLILKRLLIREDLQKKGWDIEEFNLRSKGFEVIVKKGSNRMTFIDKLPELVLKQAAKKVR